MHAARALPAAAVVTRCPILPRRAQWHPCGTAQGAMQQSQAFSFPPFKGWTHMGRCQKPVCFGREMGKKPAWPGREPGLCAAAAGMMLWTQDREPLAVLLVPVAPSAAGEGWGGAGAGARRQKDAGSVTGSPGPCPAIGCTGNSFPLALACGCMRGMGGGGDKKRHHSAK